LIATGGQTFSHAMQNIQSGSLIWSGFFVDAAAVMYLLGTEMDYKKEEFSSSFIFKNPNETERCGCGESFKT